MPQQLSPLLEERIVALALGHPGFGPKRMASELARGALGEEFPKCEFGSCGLVILADESAEWSRRSIFRAVRPTDCCATATAGQARDHPALGPVKGEEGRSNAALFIHEPRPIHSSPPS